MLSNIVKRLVWPLVRKALFKMQAIDHPDPFESHDAPLCTSSPTQSPRGTTTSLNADVAFSLQLQERGGGVRHEAHGDQQLRRREASTREGTEESHGHGGEQHRQSGPPGPQELSWTT